MIVNRTSVFAVGIGLVALVACRAETDREHYTVGDQGTVRFINDSGLVAYLGGCSTYSFEQLEEDRWTDRGPPLLCIWEGFAQPVEPGTSLDELLLRSAPGTWRVRSSSGLDCSLREPLNEESCGFISPVYSPPFSVAGVCDPAECGPPLGMPNWLCPDGESIAGPTDRCLSDSDTGVCGWEIADCPE